MIEISRSSSLRTSTRTVDGDFIHTKRLSGETSGTSTNPRRYSAYIARTAAASSASDAAMAGLAAADAATNNEIAVRTNRLDIRIRLPPEYAAYVDCNTQQTRFPQFLVRARRALALENWASPDHVDISRAPVRLTPIERACLCWTHSLPWVHPQSLKTHLQCLPSTEFSERYFQWAASPPSACSCMSIDRICNSKTRPSDKVTQVWRLW